VAGSVTRYSNQALEGLTAALARFAAPQHPEKTLEELEGLLERIRATPQRVEPVAEVRIHNAERRLGPEQVEHLIARYASGMSAQAVAREFNIGAATVLRLVRRAGVAVRDGRPSPATIAAAVALYKSGLSVQKVADQVGVPKSTLLRELKRAGVAMRQLGPPTPHLPGFAEAPESTSRYLTPGSSRSPR
jgi:transposase-like protein